MIDLFRDGTRLCTAGVADTFFSRFRGLMLKPGLALDEGLLIEYSPHLGSKSVHGFFMRFPLDLVFIDSDKRVVEIALLRPWRIYNPRVDCRWVLELNAGFAERHGLKVGDVLSFSG
ncbi:MAG TPA: DUF192 domain-containing protein [Euryarchaeota archaeon]|nr:DUF192 domain-containing protein [Euryarchaeota archaeon]